MGRCRGPGVIESRDVPRLGGSYVWLESSVWDQGPRCGVLHLGGRGTVYSKGNGGPWKGRSLCFLFFVDFSLKLVFFKKQSFI